MLKLATGLIYCFIGNPWLIFHEFFPSVRAKNQPVTHLGLVFPRTSYDRAALVVADEQHLQTASRTSRYTFELQPASLREPIKQRCSWEGAAAGTNACQAEPPPHLPGMVVVGRGSVHHTDRTQPLSHSLHLSTNICTFCSWHWKNMVLDYAVYRGIILE